MSWLGSWRLPWCALPRLVHLCIDYPLTKTGPPLWLTRLTALLSLGLASLTLGVDELAALSCLTSLRVPRERPWVDHEYDTCEGRKLDKPLPDRLPRLEVLSLVGQVSPPHLQ